MLPREDDVLRAWSFRSGGWGVAPSPAPFVFQAAHLRFEAAHFKFEAAHLRFEAAHFKFEAENQAKHQAGLTLGARYHTVIDLQERERESPKLCAVASRAS